MALPLADVRIIAIEQYGAGPWGTLQLADLGAEVIKIEDPAVGGDVGRYVPPFAGGRGLAVLRDVQPQQEVASRWTCAVRAGARSSSGLVAGCRRGLLEPARRPAGASCEITYDDLRDINPAIVCCSLSGFGMTGPRRDGAGLRLHHAGHGRLDEPDRRARRAADQERPVARRPLRRLRLGDRAARRPVAGAPRRRRLRLRHLAVRDGALHQLMYVGTWTANGGYTPTRMPESAHPSIVPFQAFATADGWITVACAKQKFYELLCDALDRADLIADPRFADFAAAQRQPRGAAAAACVRSSRGARPTSWLDDPRGGRRARTGRSTTSPRRSRTRTRSRATTSSRSSTRASARSARSPRPCASATSPIPLRRGPHRGEHTDAVLRELCGYGDEDLAALRAGGTFGPAG